LAAAALSEREVASAELLESEERYRVVVEGAADAIITTDSNRHIEFANRAAARVFGYAATDLVGRDLATLLPSFADHGRPADSAPAPGNKDLADWGVVVSVVGRHSTGNEIPMEASFGWLAVAERPVLIGILRDMSEQRAAERALGAVEDRMRFALEASGAGVWDVDFVSLSARWSESLEKLHGLPAGTFGGTLHAFLDLVHPDDRDTVAKAIADATQQRRDAQLLYRSQWPDGSIHWISSIGRTSYDVSGIPRSATGISLDVTERRNLEEQYRQSQKMEAIGQLAGGVAHDFNNVLTAIQGYTSLVSNALAAESELQSDLAEIAHGVKRAAALTRQLLAFSRRQVLTPTVLSLADSVRGMESMLKRLIGEHIEIVVQTEHDAGHVRADAGQIEQVILNLALNARDAMPDGGVLLIEVTNVNTTNAPDPKHIDPISGPCVMLAVTDTGIGMDPETVSRIFEPFFTTKPQDRGTGLGLSIVYGIVSQSDGRVYVYSEPGRGTTFKVYLPRVDESITTVVSNSTVDVRIFSETILLVEDDGPLRQLAQRTLESRGYSVLAAATPHEAMQIVDSHPQTIHLLLTDVILPEMNGPALAERISAQRAGMRVLYMSGYTDDAIFRQGILERHVHFVQKPFAHEELLRKVRSAMESKVI
jgi:PAS domain S-box-containing protein